MVVCSCTMHVLIVAAVAFISHNLTSKYIITFNTMGRHSFQKDAILCMCPPTHPYQVVPHGRNNGSKYYQSAINCRTISRNDDLPRISGGRKSGGYSESLSGSTILYTASPVQPSQVGGVIVYTASTVR